MSYRIIEFEVEKYEKAVGLSGISNFTDQKLNLLSRKFKISNPYEIRKIPSFFNQNEIIRFAQRKKTEGF